MLLSAEQSLLAVIDLQERLAVAMHGLEPVLDNTAVLIQSADRLGIPVLLTEQYPRGLGSTLPRIGAMVPPERTIEKMEFSAASNGEFQRRLAASGRSQIVVCGTEAHVCVLQTVLGLSGQGYTPVMVRDACTSRRVASLEAACARAAGAGAQVVTTEMVVFEWLRRAGTDEFRALSKLIK